MFKKISEKNIARLKDIVGESNLISGSKELAPYSCDESVGLTFFPETVLLPVSEKQLKAVVELALKEKFPLTPRGGGTSLTGSPLPLFGGAVISFEKMDSIIDIDPISGMAVVEPGVITGNLDREAEKYGLFYPVNPASLDSCTLGGNTATAAGGANTVRYGTTRSYITGIRAVDGQGKSWEAGGKIVKNASDHQLIQLAAGSEGILSLFTRLTFRLVRRPSETAWIMAPFKKTEDIPGAGLKLLNHNPTMLEIMDRNTIECCLQYSGEKIERGDLSHLMARFDFFSSSEREKTLLRAGESCMENGAEDVFIAETRQQQERIWKLRSSIHDAIEATAGSLCQEDVVVPRGKTGELIRSIRNISLKYNSPAAVYGHLGDGNIHANFTGKTYERDKVKKIKVQLFKAVHELGGKISGEHGIGITKKNFFTRYTDTGYIKILKKIKKVLDPGNILNPGKII